MPALDVASYLIDIIGTLAFAVAGAMVGADRHMDLFGVLSMGVVTAMGGGVMRDILLGQFPARAFFNYDYIFLAVMASLVVFIIIRAFRQAYSRNRLLVEAVNNVFDAIGLAAFSITGVQIAIQSGHGENWIFCVFLGMMTGVGVGILRDMLCRMVPMVFTKHIYAVASIAGSLLYYICAHFHAEELGTILVMVTVIAVRILARIYHWNLPRIQFPMEK